MKSKYYLPSKSLLTLYYALVYPYLKPKLNTICPQNLFLHFTMPLLIHSLLQFNLGLFLCHQPARNLPITEKSSPVDL